MLADGRAKHKTTNQLKRAQQITYFKRKNLCEISTYNRLPDRTETGRRRLVVIINLMFFNRYITSLKTMPLMTRLLLASLHQHDAHNRPFGPLQEQASMDRYLTYQMRFLCYYINVIRLPEDELINKHRVKFTAEQIERLIQLDEHLEDDDHPDKQLKDDVL